MATYEISADTTGDLDYPVAHVQGQGLTNDVIYAQTVGPIQPSTEQPITPSTPDPDPATEGGMDFLLIGLFILFLARRWANFHFCN